MRRRVMLAPPPSRMGASTPPVGSVARRRRAGASVPRGAWARGRGIAKCFRRMGARMRRSAWTCSRFTFPCCRPAATCGWISSRPGATRTMWACRVWRCLMTAVRPSASAPPPSQRTPPTSTSCLVCLAPRPRPRPRPHPCAGDAAAAPPVPAAGSVHARPLCLTPRTRGASESDRVRQRPANGGQGGRRRQPDV